MFARAMPWLFVLIWSTGFVVARLAMPHAPPFGFLTLRFALSAACFVVWIALAGAAWPKGRRQWLHLAVIGVLMQAAYLGGVWSAVKSGLGAGTAALLVGLQPVLTALWLTRSAEARGASSVAGRQWLGLVLGFAGLGLVVWRKLGGEVTPANLAMATVALIGITIGTLYQKRFLEPCDVRTASAVQMVAVLTVFSLSRVCGERGMVVLRVVVFQDGERTMRRKPTRRSTATTSTTMTPTCTADAAAMTSCPPWNCR